MNELYNILKGHVNESGLPIMDNPTFEKYTNEYGIKLFRETLAEYISKERPAFPFNNISSKKMESDFWKLFNYNVKKHIKSKDDIEREVIEKYDDYKYNFKEHGLGIIDAPSICGAASNYFMQELRLACGSYGYKSPVDVWKYGTAKEIWRCFGPIWRGINGVQKDKNGKISGGYLQKNSYLSAFRLGTYIATQFKPVVAKCIYDMTYATKVLDTSCGWGDRLCGFYASNAEEYIGCDPNPSTYEIYQEQCRVYEKILGYKDDPIIQINPIKFVSKGKKNVTIYRCGAEDLPWADINEIDCAFTSPPYFATEEYNKGGEYEEDQSWFKFNEYEKWRNMFYIPVSKNSFDSLSANGHLLINILDPKVKGIRYRSGDELIDSMEEHFKGQIGMRIMQRPQGKTVFSDEDGKFDKDAMDEYMNKIYIENIWYFTKNKDQNIFDYSAKSDLTSYFT